MKVILINGSPRGKMCTYTALNEVAAELNRNGIDTEIFNIGNKPIRGCIACGKCAGNENRCIFGDDDGVNEAIEKITEADGVIIGSPVYYSSPNGSLLSFLDRVFHAKNSFAFKPAAAVLSARRAGTTASLEVINKYFMISNMPIVSSSYWNAVHGNTPEEVMKDEEGLQTMRNLARNMAWIIKSINMAEEAGLKKPEIDTNAKTNFIK